MVNGEQRTQVRSTPATDYRQNLARGSCARDLGLTRCANGGESTASTKNAWRGISLRNYRGYGRVVGGHLSAAPARRVYIPKAGDKTNLRPLGIPSLRDRIVERAMLMAMQPIWESDFHRLSYGFRPERSVHHAIRTVKFQLQDGDSQSLVGRWIIEGDLASYFDTVHHRLLMRAVRKRIADQRFLALLWKLIKAGSVDRGLFRAASEGVPQGGVLSPLLSNIMLNEFDQWMETNYLSKKVRKDRWAWNFGILKRRPITVREGRQWKPAVAYCRYADDFTLVVKGTQGARTGSARSLSGLSGRQAKAHAQYGENPYHSRERRLCLSRSPDHP